MHKQPILRLELESMRHTILKVLQDQAIMLDTQINAAVRDYCTADNLESIVPQQVQVSVDDAIHSEIRDYYRHGKGRAFIKKAVELTLGDSE